MSSVIISGDTSGAITVSAPLVAGTNTLTLQAATATSAVNTLATAVASTSGTSIDFTSIPSWVKRITVMFSGVSTVTSSNYLIQLGDSGGIENTGYTSIVAYTGSAIGKAVSTSGFVCVTAVGSQVVSGQFVITLVSGNVYVQSGCVGDGVDYVFVSGGTKTLSATLDRIRITTAGGTDTFDAGSVNLLLEG